MKLVTSIVVIALVGWSSVRADDAPADSVRRVRVKPDRSYAWAKAQYPYITYRDTIFTAESEFFWPEGFHRPDSQKLTPFQFWISYLPLWHVRRPVGALTTAHGLPPERVSRPVHFPRWSSIFADKTIPLELWGEFLQNRKRRFDMKVIPYIGKPLTYADFLANTITYDAHGEILYTPSVKRQDNEGVFTDFVELCDHQTIYRSLAANGDSIPPDDLLPGDMYITWNETGHKGTVVIILTTIMNAKGEKVHAVGVGCADECDLHIPLFNNDRNFPWISAARIPELFPSKGTAGFFRPRIK